MLQPKIAAFFAATALALLAGPASAAVTYHFDFFTGSSNPYAPFSLEITTPTYITTTGLAPLDTPRATTLGYDVKNFGENSIGWFGFSNAGGSLFDDVFSFSSTTILFAPDSWASNFFTAPGVYNGHVTGNAPGGGFSNSEGVLTITASVPEPASWALFIGGFGLTGAAMRRRRHAVA